jgi:hypothetical protein
LAKSKAFYSDVKEGVIKEIPAADVDTNFKLMQKEYKEIFSVKQTKTKTQPQTNVVSQCLDKFQEFKNSLKKLYGLESNDLMCDNRIINFLQKENVNNAQEGTQQVQDFFLEASIDMYREIFKK